MNETDLLHALIESVPFELPHVRVFRRNIINRAVEIEGRRVHLRNGISGQGDAYALVQGGRHIEIETKAARGAMRAAQVSWSGFCATWGVPHVVLRARRGEPPGETVGRWVEELRDVVTRGAIDG